MRERTKAFFRQLGRGIGSKNPVLFEAIGMAPVVAMAVSLKSAIILAVVSCAELIGIELFACLALKKLKSYFRVPLYAVLGVLINIPVFMLFEKFAPNETQNAGIFLPLLAVNSLIVLHCERFAVKNTLSATAADAVSAGAGYALVCLLVGVLREIFGSGTLYSFDLGLPVQLPGFLDPFGGLVLLGFLSAGVQALVRRQNPEAQPGRAFDTREIAESHVDSLRSLLHTDFDPYEEKTPDDAPQETPARRKKTSERAKQEKKPKRERTAKRANRAESPAPDTTASERALRRAQAAAQPDYTAEFDEILSELDAYRERYAAQPQPQSADEPDGANAEPEADTEEKGGDEA